MFTKRLNFLSIGGIKIGIDITWLLIAILLTWTLAVGYFPLTAPKLTPLTYWIMGFVGMVFLFISIVLHELGHALVAKHYNLPISRITLFIFGGVAEIEKEPESPKVEFLMAIAGPVVTALLIVVFYFLYLAGNTGHWPIEVTAVLGYLFWFNLVILIFNMIPAFPLDGGRIFRSILWGWKKDLGFATSVVTSIGIGFSFFLIFFGILTIITGGFLSGIWIVIIGMFLRYAATASRTQFYVKESLKDEKVTHFMNKNPITVPCSITIKEFIENYLYQSHHNLYPVVEGGELLGYISLREVKSLKASDWEKSVVSQVLVPLTQFKTFTPNTNAADALEEMQRSDLTTFLVSDGSRLLGILTSADLFKIIHLKLELEDQLRK